MDYSYYTCMDSFTKGQTVRMQECANAFRRPGGRVAPSEKKTSTAVSVTASSTTSLATSRVCINDRKQYAVNLVLVLFCPFFVQSSGASTTSAASASTTTTNIRPSAITSSPLVKPSA
ncbi:hypothetical protein CPC08DRAFT_108643 [Agrocybe pediades]|nr:hypothetical protein CPC08DRAFT_108643 [Agrocybe pediades]